MKSYPNTSPWSNIIVYKHPRGYIHYYTQKHGNFLHRIGGPALIYPPPMHKHLWYFEGLRYSFKRYCELARPYMTDEEYLVMILTYT